MFIRFKIPNENNYILVHVDSVLSWAINWIEKKTFIFTQENCIIGSKFQIYINQYCKTVTVPKCS